MPSLPAALNQFKAQAPNLLVVDLDGFQDAWTLIRRIRATSEFGSPKVILVSQKGLSDHETELALRQGVNGCVAEVKALATEVGQLLRCSPRMGSPAGI